MRGCCSLPAGGKRIGLEQCSDNHKGRKRPDWRGPQETSGSRESEILSWLGVKDTCPALLHEQYKQALLIQDRSFLSPCTQEGRGESNLHLIKKCNQSC